jgi:hypothetical protein
MLLKHKPHVGEYFRNFDAVGLVFMPTNPGLEDLYGGVAVPLAYIERNWSDYFRIINYIEDHNKFWQAVFIVQRI